MLVVRTKLQRTPATNKKGNQKAIKSRLVAARGRKIVLYSLDRVEIIIYVIIHGLRPNLDGQHLSDNGALKMSNKSRQGVRVKGLYREREFEELHKKFKVKKETKYVHKNPNTIGHKSCV